MKHSIVTAVTILLLSLPAYSELFTDTVLHELEIEFYSLTPENWKDSLQWGWEEATYRSMPNTYFPAKVTFDGRVIDSVGIRYKGEYSMNGVKKPFKLDFNEWIDQKLDGVDKLNLQGAMDDTSQIRDKMCYDIFDWVGVPAPRASFVKVTVQGEYYGLMTAVEQVEKQFRKYNYDETAGNLFKAYFATFEDSSELLNEYEPYPLTPKNHESAPDYSTIREIYRAVITGEDATIGEVIRNYFDIHSFIGVMAVDQATTSYDNFFCGAGANVYFFEDALTNKVKVIPWDYNLSLQRLTSYNFYDGIDQITPWDTVINITSTVTKTVENRSQKKKLLREGVFGDELNKTRYFQELFNIADGMYDPTVINGYIDRYYSLIKEAVYADGTVNNSDFDRSIQEVKDYFAWQRTNILDQLTALGVVSDPYVSVVSLSPTTQEITIGLGDSNKVIIPVTVTPSNVTYTNLNWSSEDRDIAKVSGFGEIEGKVPGTTVITVRSPNGGTPQEIMVTVVDDVVALEQSRVTSSQAQSLTVVKVHNELRINTAMNHFTVELFTVSGEMVQRTENRTVVPTSNLASGVYFARIKTVDGIVSRFSFVNR